MMKNHEGGLGDCHMEYPRYLMYKFYGLLYKFNVFERRPPFFNLLY